MQLQDQPQYILFFAKCSFSSSLEYINQSLYVVFFIANFVAFSYSLLDKIIIPLLEPEFAIKFTMSD